MSDEARPKARKYGALAGAGLALTVGQMYVIQEFVFTRKEAEAQEKRIDRLEETVSHAVGAIHGDIRAVRAEMSLTNRNVGILMHELKVKAEEAEDLRTRLTEEQKDY